MKKVGLFICALSSGGAEHQLSILANFLAERGYDVSVITFSSMPDHYVLNNTIHRTNLQSNGSKFKTLIKIFRFFVNSKLDCVISFGQRESILCLFPLLFRPRVVSIAGERNITLKPNIIEDTLFRFLYYRSNWVVSNSVSQKEYIVAKNPKLLGKTITISNYTDINAYIYKNYPKNEIIEIGVFSRYHKQKNYPLFAEAISLLCNMTNVPFHVSWYGNIKDKEGKDNDDYLAFCKLIDSMGISKVVSLRNHVEDVSSEISKYDCICLPSLIEGFSNAISEAISCGRPVLCSDISDNHIMVKHGINGFLFNPHDPNDIAQAFLNFFALSREDKELMSIRSREIAESLFDKDRFIESYIKLIES